MRYVKVLIALGVLAAYPAATLATRRRPRASVPRW